MAEVVWFKDILILMTVKLKRISIKIKNASLFLLIVLR